MGNFNKNMMHNKKARRTSCLKQYLHVFRNVVFESDLVDLGFFGYPFICDNGCHSDTFMEERLDRALVSLSWKDIFPNARLHHVLHPSSNHLPLILDLDGVSFCFEGNKSIFILSLRGRNLSSVAR